MHTSSQPLNIDAENSEVEKLCSHFFQLCPLDQILVQLAARTEN